MNVVTVIGAGLSGLATAYYLARAGLGVQVLERSDRVGGLIRTARTPHGLVEAAASMVRNSARIEALSAELNVPLVWASPRSRARYIYRGGASRWPLKLTESAALVGRLALAGVRGRAWPRPQETIEAWGTRVLGHSATKWMLAAALQGVYGGDPERMSASLIVGRHRRAPPARYKGLVAPPNGMGQLVEGLEQTLRASGVSIHFNEEAHVNGTDRTVICTSAPEAARLLSSCAAAASEALSRIDMLPIVRITAFYGTGEKRHDGIGILFPRDQGVRALGVLFNTNMFPHAAAGHAESWIYGGARDRGVVELSDPHLFEVMDRDRERVLRRNTAPVVRYVYRWSEALPHYDVHLETVLARGFDLPPGLFLVGNYLGGIGIPMLFERAAAVAGAIATEHGQVH